MKLATPFMRAALVLATTLVLGASAQARNDMLMRPVAEAMRGAHAVEIVGDLPVRFGAASAANADIVSDVTIEGVGSVVGDDPRKRRIGNPSAEEVCLQAFEDALQKAVAAARKAGAAAILGVVSDYKGVVHDDPQAYECHAGSVYAYVTLRAELARSLPASRPLPPASNFASLDDLSAVPISEEGRERYRHFLTLAKPRAFVIYADGRWRFFAHDPQAMTKALDECARLGRPCWLYAADDRVVWTADVARRIGTSAQLEGRGAAAPAASDENQ